MSKILGLNNFKNNEPPINWRLYLGTYTELV